MLWDDSLACGIAVIDEEHKQLFRQLDVLEAGNDAAGVGETLDFLGEYVVKHFAHEQLMHKRSGFPQAPEHRIMHERFVTVYDALRNEYVKKGENPEIMEKLVKTVVLWLREHIMGMDKAFADFYRDHTGGTAE